MSIKLLLLVTVIGLGLRLFQLGTLPVGFSPDEASYGYNAYSLLQTGRDEWGAPWYQLFSSNLRSFGDYRFPLYAFLAVPAVALFGLSEFATRLPNALLGTLAIPATYLLASRLFPSRKSRVALFSTLFLALCSWHISLSRGAFEANSLTLFFPLAIYAFLSNRFSISALLFGLNFYTYVAAKILSIPFILVLGLYKKSFKPTFWLPLLLLCLPGFFAFVGRSGVRVTDVSIANPTDNWQAVSNRRYEAVLNNFPDPLARLFSNKPLYVLSQFTKNYLGYFSPQFFFTNGSGEDTYGVMSGRGLLYYLQLPLLALVLINYFRRPTSTLSFLLILIVLSPLAAALSKGGGYAANRTAALIPFVSIISGLGLYQLMPRVRGIFVGLLILSLAFFLEDYYYHSPAKFAVGMHYGWRQLSPDLPRLASNFSNIQVSRGLSEPHIYIAFYLRVPPSIYQQAAQSWRDFDTRGYLFLDQLDGYTLGNFRFGNIHPQDPVTQPTLFIGRPEDFGNDITTLSLIIRYPNGKPAIMLATKYPSS